MRSPRPSVEETAEQVLVAHQRLDIRSCLCGWAELGKSHARHQVAMLGEAGVLGDTIRGAGPAEYRRTGSAGDIEIHDH